MNSSNCRRDPSVVLEAFALGSTGCTALNREARRAALIARAKAALGSAALKTLTITGRSRTAGAWSRSMNFETDRFREEFISSHSEPQGGGALLLMGKGESRGVVLQDMGMVSRIEFFCAHPVLGEMPVISQVLDSRLRVGLMLP